MLGTTTITCPYCWEDCEIVVDLSVEGQRYVEDCFVCCRPIVIDYRAEGGRLIAVSAVGEDE